MLRAHECLIIVNCVVVIFTNIASGVILTTKQGILKGAVEKSRGGRSFYSFYNIPYAEPPIGKLRFQNPIPAKPWKGTRDATILPPICLNHEYSKLHGQEDCLYLNVYTSKITNGTLLPVMLFIYGGRFMYGNALPDRYGPHYFMDRDVVLITFHYRLGILGYLSTEDEVIPGNYGFKDVIMALKWIQNYIYDFGGDNNRVTLFGGSSGGESATLTLISPLAEGLFHRLITQSVPFTLIERPGKAKLNAWKVGSMVGCDGDEVNNSEQLLNCLRNLPAEDLALKNENFYTHGGLLPIVPWGPVIENEKVAGAFLVDEPRKLLARRSSIPWISGMNSNDGGMSALFVYFGFESDAESVLHELDTNYKEIFPKLFEYEHRFEDIKQLDFATEAYKKYYFGEKNISQDIHGFAKMCTSIFLIGLREAVKLYSGSKYIYYYDHRNRENFARWYSDADIEMGVLHGDELISMFNWSSAVTPVTEGVDLVVSEKMLDLWTNFAANGDPNNPDEIIWNPVESSDINYLHIKDGAFEMKKELLKEEAEFLESFFVAGTGS
ncbi:juvenile hormone esterase-like [Planococcus citri]|uniref:juvenile hormone esterase-like n=1 Tax=Planococcus citri TaxID=170843 RepID=UPI0031F7A04A